MEVLRFQIKPLVAFDSRDISLLLASRLGKSGSAALPANQINYSVYHNNGEGIIIIKFNDAKIHSVPMLANEKAAIINEISNMPEFERVL